jgi:hypothetical protein
MRFLISTGGPSSPEDQPLPRVGTWRVGKCNVYGLGVVTVGVWVIENVDSGTLLSLFTNFR